MEKIAVIGSGTMGSGIAQTAAANGFPVVLKDISAEVVEKGIKKIEKNLQREVEKQKIKDDQKKEILNRIDSTFELEKIIDSDIIIEAVSENLKIKKSLFKELDKAVNPECIIVSNTSALSITELAASTTRPDKIMGMHFFNPVPQMKLVELIKAFTTSENTYKKIEKFSQAINKKAVLVEEAPGFVVNRILIPMINEAVFILDEGRAEAENIDKAVQLGANHPIGPLKLADLIGLDVCLSIMETLYSEFSDPKYRPAPLLRKMVRSGKLGRKTKSGFYDYN